MNRLIPTKELEDWASKISGIKYVDIHYNWTLNADYYAAEAYSYPKSKQIVIKINGNGWATYRPTEELQQSYILHELGHYFNHSKSHGAQEFSAQFWAIKKTYYTGMLKLNCMARYMLRKFQGACSYNTSDNSYDKAFKIGKRLKII